VNSIPDCAVKIIDKHIFLIDSSFPNVLESYYIYGSISLGVFSYGLSDIDFIAVLNRKITDMDINILKEIHKNIKKEFPKTDLMGSYITKDDLLEQYANSKTCPCFIGGKYKGLIKFDKNSIDAYQLKRYGIAIKGESSSNFDYTVNWNTLRSSMRDNLNGYWKNWMNSCMKFPSINYLGLYVSLKTIEWGVLGVSRLYYTFHEKDITSKIGAGEYVLKNVPERWHRIINESMRLRKGNEKSYYNSIFERRNDAFAYIDYIIQESN
jgi:hypothetical protein